MYIRSENIVFIDVFSYILNSKVIRNCDLPATIFHQSVLTKEARKEDVLDLVASEITHSSQRCSKHICFIYSNKFIGGQILLVFSNEQASNTSLGVLVIKK